jgi:hypothetical protein
MTVWRVSKNGKRGVYVTFAGKVPGNLRAAYRIDTAPQK